MVVRRAPISPSWHAPSNSSVRPYGCQSTTSPTWYGVVSSSYTSTPNRLNSSLTHKMKNSRILPYWVWMERCYSWPSISMGMSTNRSSTSGSRVKCYSSIRLRFPTTSRAKIRLHLVYKTCRTTSFSSATRMAIRFCVSCRSNLLSSIPSNLH